MMDIKNRITLDHFSDLIDGKRTFMVKIGGRECGKLEMNPREFFMFNGVISSGHINLPDYFFEELEKYDENGQLKEKVK
jgi:hypothetical protein